MTNPTPNLTGLPFDDIRSIAADAPELDSGSASAVRRNVAAIEDHPGALAPVAEACSWIAAVAGTDRPQIGRVQLCAFGGATRFADDEQFDDERTRIRQRWARLSSGGSPASVIAGELGAGLKLFDLGLEQPLNGDAEDGALDERATVATMAFGMEALVGGADLLVLSAGGPGSARVVARLRRALTSADRPDPLRILGQLGSREIAAAAGAILAARTQRVAVLLVDEGAAAAALVIEGVAPGLSHHCRSAGGRTRQDDDDHHYLFEEELAAPAVQGSDGLAGLLSAQFLRSACAIVSGAVPVDAI